jgi:hypothetical protein
MFAFRNCATLTVGAMLVFLAACQSGNVPSASALNAPAASQRDTTSLIPEPTDTMSVLKGLNKNVVIGSTVDPNNGDQGPHSLSIVKFTYGLKKGQLVVCNFADSSGTPGNGTTIEVLNPQPSSSPTQFAQSKDIKGCTGTALTSGNQVYATGLTSGLLVWFNQAGQEQTTYGSPRVAPFGLADVYTGKEYASEYMFTSDASTGSMESEGTPGYGSGFSQQVATGFPVGNASQTGWNTLGPSGLSYHAKTDTLYIADGASNAIVLFTHASEMLVKNEIVVKDNGLKFTCPHKKVTCGKVVHHGSPLGEPVAMTLLPNGNLVVANTQPGTSGGNVLVELTPKGQILDTKVVDSGATPAIFGLASSGKTDSNTVVYYTDTNDNSVHELEP